MAAVYKTLSKASGGDDQKSGVSTKKNKQRVLILSSRGVTYRYVLHSFLAALASKTFLRYDSVGENVLT